MTSLSPSPVDVTDEATQYLIDENDGPLYFNRYPPPPSSQTFAIHPLSTRNIDGGNWWEH